MYRYPMCKDQSAQIDCRNRDCRYYKGAGKCSNVSPAITLNPDKSFVCWSKEEFNFPKELMKLQEKHVSEQQKLMEEMIKKQLGIDITFSTRSHGNQHVKSGGNK